jgi:hypothetical protein
MTQTFAIVLVFFAAIATAAEPARITFDAADARLRRAYALARETNDSTLIEKVLEFRDLVRRSFSRKDVAAAERLIRDAEELVGLDAGGKSMLGLPIAQIDADQRKKLDSFEDRLAAAMKKEDVSATTAVIGEMRKLLGDSAGMPDIRRKGEKGRAVPIKPVDVADVFVKVIEADPRALKVLSVGMPAAHTQARSYAAIAEGCLTIRPLIEANFKDKLGTIDGLIRGCCKAMIALQLADGHFKFPDLRGKNFAVGETIDKQVDGDPDAVRDGWLVAAFTDGSSQVDAAECGIALLRAAQAFKNAEWTGAGLKAAGWSAKFATVPTFHFNACSISLLCAAFESKGEQKYLDSAMGKYRLGIAPGQTANGRWLDPESARTGNHLALIRCLHDLADVTPVEKRDEIIKSASLAMKSLVDEAEKLGVPITQYTIQELDRHIRLVKGSEASVRGNMELAASAAVQRCTQGGKIRAAVPLPELAAAAQVFAK